MRKVLVLIILILLASCAGGTLGNLFPMPKFLKGSIEDGLYTSPKGIFSVLAPFSQGSTPFTYMEVQESSRDSWDGVTFYSSTHSRNRYRVEVGLASQGDVIQDTDHYLNESSKYFMEKYTTAGATNYQIVMSGKMAMGNGDASFSIHRYTAPSNFSVLNIASTAPYQAWILIVTRASKCGLLYMSFEFAGNCEPCSRGDIEALRDGRGDIDRMLDSIKVRAE